jgi:hypothetical protein
MVLFQKKNNLSFLRFNLTSHKIINNRRIKKESEGIEIQRIDSNTF